jgi:hypothetical protein
VGGSGTHTSGGAPGVGGGHTGVGGAAMAGAPGMVAGAGAGAKGSGGAVGGSAGGAHAGTGGAAGPSGTALVGSPFEAARVVVPSAINRDNYSTTALWDVDGDGSLEVLSLAHVMGSMRSLQVSFHDGHGAFRDPITTPLDTGADGGATLLLTDVDNDGHLDAVVALAPAGRVVVLLGHGDGSFTQGREFAFTASSYLFPPTLAAGDLDGDGAVDLVGIAPGDIGAALVVLMGKGDGTFGARATYDTGVQPSAVQVTDLTDDGRPDVLVTDGALLLFRNKGDGRLDEATTVHAGGTTGYPYATRIADLNGDGRPDLIVSQGNGVDGQGLAVRLNQGGTFGAPATHLDGLVVVATVIADVNGDKQPDIVAGTGTLNRQRTSNDGLSVLLNQGGTFAPPALYLSGCAISAIVAGDLDGDGRIDMAVNPLITAERQRRDQVQVLFNAGGGKLGAPLELAGCGTVAAIADMDDDGDADIAADNGAVVFTNGGGRVFPQLLRSPSSVLPRSVVLSDLDGDGHLDAAYVDEASAGIMLGRDDGTFAPSSLVDMHAPGVPGVGDLDGDGKPDLVLPFGGPGARIGVAMNEGSGRFGGLVSYPSGPYASASATADLNGDGKVDIATLVAGAVAVHLNDGHGAFPSYVEYPQLEEQLVIVLADLDGTGGPDIVTAGRMGVYTFRNRGDGAFDRALKYGPGGLAVALLDLTGDGRPELAVGGHADALRIHRNNGQGVFGDGTPVAVPALRMDIGALATGDLNGDGRADLVALSSNYTSGYAATFISDGAGSLARGDTFSVGGSGIALADLNRDRQDDLMVWGSKGVYVFPQPPADSRKR